MYARYFRKADDTLKFTITDAGDAGWEVREEQGTAVVKRTLYTDWHRVERARMNFTRMAMTLELAGWTES
jgi:hypothetical protein